MSRPQHAVADIVITLVSNDVCLLSELLSSAAELSPSEEFPCVVEWSLWGEFPCDVEWSLWEELPCVVESSLWEVVALEGVVDSKDSNEVGIVVVD